MADKKITQFDTFEGTADSGVFFVVASGDASNSLSKNYRFPFDKLSSDVIGANSPWKFGSNSIYTLTGAVGMGTSTPGYQLDVATTGRFRDDLIVSGDLYVSGTTHVQKIIDVSITGTISGVTGEFADGVFADSLTISGVSVATGMDGKWEDGVAAGEIYYDGGYVGIGTNNPETPLHVNAGPVQGIGLFNSSDSPRGALGLDGSDNGNIVLWNATDDLLSPSIKLSSDGPSIFSGGAVGVGTDNPQGSLTIKRSGAGTDGIRLYSHANDLRAAILTQSAEAGAYFTLNDSAGLPSVILSAEGVGTSAHFSEDVKIGFLGAALARLHVSGGDGRILAPSGDFTSGLFISGVSVATGMGGKWVDGTTAGEIYYDGGYVGIGTNNPESPLHVNAGATNEGIGLFNSSNSPRGALGLDGLDNGSIVLWGANDALTAPSVVLGSDGYSILDGGDVAIGNVPSRTPLARLHVTGGDGRILAPSGDFTSGLFISGVPVSTGAGGAGKWIDDPAYALGITYEDGPVAISGDLRVSGSGYFSSNTLLVGDNISLKAADDYLMISGSGIKVGDPGSEGIVLTTDKMGLGTTADLAEEPSDINFKLLTDQNRFVVGTTGQPGGDLSGWYRFNDYTVKGASDMGAHIMNPVDTRIYTEGTSFMVLTEDSDGAPIGYIANGTGALSANNAIAIGIAPKLDESETPRDLEFTDTDGESYSVINGDSDSVGINGLPLSQGLQAPSMGAAPAALLIDGGYF